MPRVRRLAILTTGRQDYGVLRSTILLLRETPGLESELWAGGMHLQERFGPPLALLQGDGTAVARKLAFLSEPPAPVKDAGEALKLVGDMLLADRPDAIMLVGDRAETLAAGLAATLARVPIVHLHGGEESEGAIDNAFRHALTKLSHLHLVSHQMHAERVLRMGEDPASVVVVGAPGLDNAFRADLPGRAELEGDIGQPLPAPLVLVTVHPTTLGEDPEAEVTAVAAAMASVAATYVVTFPNADEGGHAIRESWRRWARGRSGVALVEALGEQRYWGMLRIASAVLGNSSSGVLEAPALGLPVVNVGDRQKGRLRYGRVVDVPVDPVRIADALRSAVAGGPQQGEAGATGYPPGPAAPRILEALSRWDVPRPPRKRFHRYP